MWEWVSIENREKGNVAIQKLPKILALPQNCINQKHRCINKGSIYHQNRCTQKVWRSPLGIYRQENQRSRDSEIVGQDFHKFGRFHLICFPYPPIISIFFGQCRWSKPLMFCSAKPIRGQQRCGGPRTNHKPCEKKTKTTMNLHYVKLLEGTYIYSILCIYILDIMDIVCSCTL